MRRILAVPALLVVLALPSACGDDTSGSGASATTRAAGTTTTLPTTPAPTSGPAVSVGTTVPVSPPTTALPRLQPAIWPAASEVFDAPEAVAADFVSKVLGVTPVLGEFQHGDARSGEIELFSPGEGTGALRVARGRLLLRQLGPEDGWFVIGVVNEDASITSPSTGASVAAGPLTVTGAALGFEATVVVSAFPAGDATTLLDSQVTQGGAMAPEPYAAAIDLSRASPGVVVAVLVRGGAGLETDPGEMAAIPVVIAG